MLVLHKLLILNFDNLKCYDGWYSVGSIPWKTVWLSCMKGLSTGHENDVNWKILHRVLSMCVYLSLWGIPNINIYCRKCENAPETIEHIFLECPVANKVWLSFSYLIGALNGEHGFNETFIFIHCYANDIARDI